MDIGIHGLVDGGKLYELQDLVFWEVDDVGLLQVVDFRALVVRLVPQLVVLLLSASVLLVD